MTLMLLTWSCIRYEHFTPPNVLILDLQTHNQYHVFFVYRLSGFRFDSDCPGVFYLQLGKTQEIL